MIKNYFKIAIRNFSRHKVFTFINIIGLSIGISAALVIYLIVHFDLTFNRFKNRENIYRVVSFSTFQGDPNYNSGVCGPITVAINGQVNGIAAYAPFFTLYQPNVFIPGNQKAPAKFKNLDNVILADGRYFQLFNYTWLAGSAKSALNEPNQVVLTSEQASLYFPNLPYHEMIGKVVNYDTIKTTVTGIVQSLTKNTDFTFHDFISYSTALSNKDLNDIIDLKDWGSTTSSSQLFVVLKPSVSISNIEKQLNKIFLRNHPPKPEDKGSTFAFQLKKLTDLHFDEQYGSFDYGSAASKKTLYGLLIIAAFLLILGCINFINLTTAQATQRAKEIGIRKTMGSSRIQLIIQFLSETSLITLFAVIISIALAPLLLKLFADFISVDVKADYLHQPGLFVFLILLTIGVSLLSGFYPALVLSGYKPVLVLKNQTAGNGQTRNAWLRKSLTVTQFVVAQFFIMATLLVSKQIYYALHKDLGFKKDAIVIINTPWKNRRQSRNMVFLNKIKAMPQVELASLGGAPPSSGNTNSTTVTFTDGKKEIKTDLELKYGDENYTKLYQLKLIAGRPLQAADTSLGFLVNEKYLHVLGYTNPRDVIGKSLKDFNSHKSLMIVGVVADFYQKSLHTPIKPVAILVGSNMFQTGTVHIALKPQPPGGDEWKKAIAAIQNQWKTLYPDDDFEYHFYDENIAKFYTAEQHTSTLLTWATGLSLFISCLGLLGLALYTTNQRTKEIGVRKVLGATVTQIVTLLSSELMWLILLAFAAVTPLAWYAMNKWEQGFADRTTISWWIFATSGGLMFLAALFTSGFQTVKAAIANPVKSLRSE